MWLTMRAWPLPLQSMATSCLDTWPSPCNSAGWPCPRLPSITCPTNIRVSSTRRRRWRGSPSPTLVASGLRPVADDMYDFICRGPLLEKSGFSPQDVIDDVDTWLESGGLVCRLLGLDEERERERARVFHYYVPVYLWCLRQLSQHSSRFQHTSDPVPPLVIGISAPQGSGKTTLVYTLDRLFNNAGRKAASISIDDFYLTADAQAKLAAENTGNTLLELRGNAGSHDLEFGSNTIKSLCSLVKEGTKAKVPRYDKSANNGRGDRADPSTWPEVEGPLEVIFFEGWMLGFKPLPGDSVKAIDMQLEAVNRNLKSYYDAWEKFIGSWIVIEVDNPQWVYKWRLEAEVAMRSEGKLGMSDEQVADFVSRYMPAYKAYLPGLYSDGPNSSKPESTLVIKIDKDRSPVG